MYRLQQQISRLPLKRISAVQFTYDLWRAGSLAEFGIKQREYSIKENRIYIRNMAIGYTEGERLHVRAKQKCIAVMFFYNETHFWTHLTNNEFISCFPEYKKLLKNIKI